MITRLLCLELALLSVIFIGGCTSTNRSVLFVTKTSIGLDIDTQPPGIAIAYNRSEGFVGPRYDSGSAPPVVARIQSGGGFAGLAGLKVRQVYATGPAAIKAIGGEAEGSKELKGNRKTMFLGTETVFGMKVSWMGALLSRFMVGFGRKEFSYIPLGEGKKGELDKYPSTIAMIDTSAKADGQSAGFKAGQFFATGPAAEEVAKLEPIQELFKELSKAPLESYQADVRLKQKADDIEMITNSLKDAQGNIDKDLLEKLVQGIVPDTSKWIGKYANQQPDVFRKDLQGKYITFVPKLAEKLKQNAK